MMERKRRNQNEKSNTNRLQAATEKNIPNSSNLQGEDKQEQSFNRKMMLSQTCSSYPEKNPLFPLTKGGQH